jgi:hypothetical protein
VPDGVAVGAVVTVPVGAGVPDGVAVLVAEEAPNSMWSRGAAAALPSHESAVRLPVPVTMIARELPLTQPGRFTISWMMAARLGVLWPGPTSFTTVQGGGVHPTVAVVLARVEMLRVVVVNVGALSLACPARVREATSVDTSSVRNCM